jgi:hypothetical protein
MKAAGGVYFRFRAGRTGTSAANVHYITRETGTEGEREALYAHNHPEHAREGETYDELRANLVEYARQAEQDELERPRRGGRGRPQTHFRAIASCKGREETDRVLGMAHDYLERRFPDARALVAVHQDRENTHAHLHIQTRDVDGQKLRFTREEWQNLDRDWALIYEREFGRGLASEHELKKQETRDYKRECVLARLEGREPRLEKPDRADRGESPEEKRQRELRSYGGYETRSGDHQREAPSGEQSVTAGERALGRFAEQSDRTESTARGALQDASRMDDRADVRGVLDRGGR